MEGEATPWEGGTHQGIQCTGKEKKKNCHVTGHGISAAYQSNFSLSRSLSLQHFILIFILLYFECESSEHMLFLLKVLLCVILTPFLLPQKLQNTYKCT